MTATFFPACATAGAAGHLRFHSNREPPDAFACTARQLEAEGFEPTESDPDSRVAVAYRHAAPSSDPAGTEWWRVEVSVTTDDEGRTVVLADVGTAPRREGPFGPPSTRLKSVAGRLSAACTW